MLKTAMLYECGANPTESTVRTAIARFNDKYGEKLGNADLVVFPVGCNVPCQEIDGVPVIAHNGDPDCVKPLSGMIAVGVKLPPVQ